MNLLADRLLNLLIVPAGGGHCSHTQQDEQRRSYRKYLLLHGCHPYWNSGFPTVLTG
jgi:hypothetical protein